MQSIVTIVMYHFVRDLKRSRWPEINALDLSDFRGQLAYIRQHYSIIRMQDLAAAVEIPENTLPPRPILLTFDDGYIDHFNNVFPLLDEISVQGSFFPPAAAVLERKVLDVNKIHFILASVPDKWRIINTIFSMMNTAREEYRLEANDVFFKRLALPNQFDPGEVIFIKRALQRGLPERLRKLIIDRLFHEHVTQDEVSFAAELYVGPDQLKCMCRHGMYIGSHGFDHLWLDTLNAAAQETEVDESLNFLKSLGCDVKDWAMCYPYGGYNDSLVSILRRKGCRIGLTTNVALADLQSENPLLLPRLDTNDLPKNAVAEPNRWTRRIQEVNRQ